MVCGISFFNMTRSPEQNQIPSEIRETRELKVEFDWNKHLKVEWKETEPLISELKSLNIEGPKGSVDILKLVNAGKVFLNYTGEEGGNLFVSSGDVEINKFDSIIDLGLLMHEFGHLDQFINENFDQDILKLALDIKIEKNDDNTKERVEVFKRVIKMFPEVVTLIKSGKINETNSKEVINLSEKIMERDATARALKYFRKISDQTGIDFFKKFKTKNLEKFDWEEELKEEDNCSKSIQEGMINPENFIETSVIEELHKALKTYHAKTLTDTYDPAKTGKRIKPKL